MRLVCYFDLPVLTASERRSYRIFRKWFIREGFIMIQNSVYVKLCLNTTVVNSVIEKVKQNRPSKGLVMLTAVTERQFANTVYVTGEIDSEYITTTDRLVIL